MKRAVDRERSKKEDEYNAANMDYYYYGRWFCCPLCVLYIEIFVGRINFIRSDIFWLFRSFCAEPMHWWFWSKGSDLVSALWKRHTEDDHAMGMFVFAYINFYCRYKENMKFIVLHHSESIRLAVWDRWESNDMERKTERERWRTETERDRRK